MIFLPRAYPASAVCWKLWFQRKTLVIGRAYYKIWTPDKAGFFSAVYYYGQPGTQSTCAWCYFCINISYKFSIKSITRFLPETSSDFRPDFYAVDCYTSAFPDTGATAYESGR